MSKVTLEKLNKTFGDVRAVKDLHFEIGQGEFFSLLGPSGCGKTTTLRMIAGFEFPTSGKIFFDSREVTFLAPNKRNTGMVFQNYALFPHMTVFENVAFGLQARKVEKPEIEQRVRRALELVELAGLARRKVTQLSGGQQQRVALARAVVIEPSILLLDEPLSNLDAKLREETREEIRSLQRRLGITTVYVTHDQEEALTLSDRIAVLEDGVCHQIGTPEEIFETPQNRFVANFVGDSNVLEGTLLENRNGFAEVEIDLQLRLRVARQPSDEPLLQGSRVALSVRPEFIALDVQAETSDTFKGTIKRVSYSGALVNYLVEVAGLTVRVRRLLAEEGRRVKVGDEATFRINSSKVTFLN